MEMIDGYSFVFVMNDRSEQDELLNYTLQYCFKSAKSHHSYIVRVEKYIEHSYCLKFFDKANIDSKNKFSLRTDTFEPRTIFYTLYHIMLDVLKKDTDASFFFIGAEDEKDELGESTRRYKIYRKFVSSTISDNVFEHYRDNSLSLYILVNKASVKDKEAFVNKLTAEVKKNFSQRG